MHWGQMAGSEHGPTIQRIDALTALTAPDGQATAMIDAKEARCAVARVAVRARQPVGMKVLHQPGCALLIVEQIYDWKVHALDFSHFARLVQLSQSFYLHQLFVKFYFLLSSDCKNR